MKCEGVSGDAAPRCSFSKNNYHCREPAAPSSTLCRKHTERQAAQRQGGWLDQRAAGSLRADLWGGRDALRGPQATPGAAVVPGGAGPAGATTIVAFLPQASAAWRHCASCLLLCLRRRSWPLLDAPTMRRVLAMRGMERCGFQLHPMAARCGAEAFRGSVCPVRRGRARVGGLQDAQRSLASASHGARLARAPCAPPSRPTAAS